MLMSVVGRTKEIGAMRSIGASKKDIIMMFLYEALILGIIGSLIGAFLSLFFGYLIVHYLLKTSLSYYAIFYYDNWHHVWNFNCFNFCFIPRI
jgi:putative ABC transport system permease protein